MHKKKSGGGASGRGKSSGIRVLFIEQGEEVGRMKPLASRVTKIHLRYIGGFVDK